MQTTGTATMRFLPGNARAIDFGLAGGKHRPKFRGPWRIPVSRSTAVGLHTSTDRGRWCRRGDYIRTSRRGAFRRLSSRNSVRGDGGGERNDSAPIGESVLFENSCKPAVIGSLRDEVAGGCSQERARMVPVSEARLGALSARSVVAAVPLRITACAQPDGRPGAATRFQPGNGSGRPTYPADGNRPSAMGSIMEIARALFRGAGRTASRISLSSVFGSGDSP